jgi:hypothetical protein
MPLERQRIVVTKAPCGGFGNATRPNVARPSRPARSEKKGGRLTDNDAARNPTLVSESARVAQAARNDLSYAT